MLQQNNQLKFCEYDGCAQFFAFAPDESDETLLTRLGEVRQKGFDRIIASYKTKGMAQVRFDDTYYDALDRLVRCCSALDISFWLEDYAPFPTGSANGAYTEDEYADQNKLMIDERHVDLHGPVKDAVIRIDALQNACYGKAMHLFSKVDPSCRSRLAVLACRLTEMPGGAAKVVIEDSTILRLDSKVRDGCLKWNIPEGHWRIFVVFTTWESSGRPYFMNLLSRKSIALEIEMVHRPLYEHLKAKLGKTWIGFFYDEPEIGNDGGDKIFDFFMVPGRRTEVPTDIEVLPWSPEMPVEMQKRDPDWLLHLPYLWYDGSGAHKSCRSRYMDAVSSLVRENYNGQVYDFCRKRGIHYIGHVLEDESCHTRLGCGPSHYFRQQYYQDEAGIDVIAGQILPGKDGPASWYGVTNSDGEFYHYGLAKLASSEAHINPLKNGRTVAECFAMYGQQGLAEQKFLLDHLLINGINRILFADLTAYEAPADYARTLAAYRQTGCAVCCAHQKQLSRPPCCTMRRPSGPKEITPSVFTGWGPPLPEIRSATM